MPTQGNALGIREKKIQALKGRNNGLRPMYRPYRAHGLFDTKYPGRCPGLIYRALSGLGICLGTFSDGI